MASLLWAKSASHWSEQMLLGQLHALLGIASPELAQRLPFKTLVHDICSLLEQRCIDDRFPFSRLLENNFTSEEWVRLLGRLDTCSLEPPPLIAQVGAPMTSEILSTLEIGEDLDFDYLKGAVSILSCASSESSIEALITLTRTHNQIEVRLFIAFAAGSPHPVGNRSCCQASSTAWCGYWTGLPLRSIQNCCWQQRISWSSIPRPGWRQQLAIISNVFMKMKSRLNSCQRFVAESSLQFLFQLRFDCVLIVF